MQLGLQRLAVALQTVLTHTFSRSQVNAYVGIDVGQGTWERIAIVGDFEHGTGTVGNHVRFNQPRQRVQVVTVYKARHPSHLCASHSSIATMLLPQLLVLTLAVGPAVVQAALFPKDSLVKMLDAKGFRKMMKQNVRRRACVSRSST